MPTRWRAADVGKWTDARSCKKLPRTAARNSQQFISMGRPSKYSLGRCSMAYSLPTTTSLDRLLINIAHGSHTTLANVEWL